MTKRFIVVDKQDTYGFPYVEYIHNDTHGNPDARWTADIDEAERFTRDDANKAIDEIGPRYDTYFALKLAPENYVEDKPYVLYDNKDDYAGHPFVAEWNAEDHGFVDDWTRDIDYAQRFNLHDATNIAYAINEQDITVAMTVELASKFEGGCDYTVGNIYPKDEAAVEAQEAESEEIIGRMVEAWTSDDVVTDNVEKPSHYQLEDGSEVLDHIFAMLGAEGFLAYAAGNAYKYLGRYADKNGVEDLRKASEYLGYMINVKEGNTPKHK